MKRVLALCAAAAALSIGCAQDAVPLRHTSLSTAAIGELEIEPDANGNSKVKFEAEHLAPPRNLRSDMSVYVAWTRQAGADGWKNAGQITVDDDREGELEFSVPYSEFDFCVTAEASGTVRERSEMIVFEGSSGRN